MNDVDHSRVSLSGIPTGYESLLQKYDYKNIDEIVCNEGLSIKEILRAPVLAIITLIRRQPADLLISGTGRADPRAWDETKIATTCLYDLRKTNHIHCVTIGRDDGQTLRPLLTDNSSDPCVSSKHALILHDKEGNILYHDIGSEGQGSRNGAYINSDPNQQIKNGIYRWQEKDFLALVAHGAYLAPGIPGPKWQFILRHERIRL